MSFSRMNRREKKTARVWGMNRTDFRHNQFTQLDTWPKSCWFSLRESADSLLHVFFCVHSYLHGQYMILHDGLVLYSKFWTYILYYII
jgi:hypothetical protein